MVDMVRAGVGGGGAWSDRKSGGRQRTRGKKRKTTVALANSRPRNAKKDAFSWFWGKRMKKQRTRCALGCDGCAAAGDVASFHSQGRV